MFVARPFPLLSTAPAWRCDVCEATDQTGTECEECGHTKCENCT